MSVCTCNGQHEKCELLLRANEDNAGLLARVEVLERTVLEIGRELRADCNYTWFSLRDLLKEIERLRGEEE